MASYQTLLLSALLPLGLFAQQDEAFQLPPDDPVMRQLDELLESTLVRNDPFTADTALLNLHGFAAIDTPSYTPAAYQARLAALDGRTPFDLRYNKIVQAYIDLYAVRKREQTSRMLGLAQLYFPMFEDALDRHGLPQELKYLAVVESALDPSARSRAGAVGLWQFITSTGKMYGMRVDSYVDERCDLYKSTDAACRYLKDLYGIFGDWDLALAAYNCGPGNVNKAIRRSGGKKDYWEAYDRLPRETRGYVPAFIAVNYVMNHAAEHNLYPVVPKYCSYELDTVQVCYPLKLEDLARTTNSDPEMLRTLNPTFRRGYVPDPDHPVTLYVPKSSVPAFIAQEEYLRYALLNEDAEVIEKEEEKAPTQHVVHVVRSGESLGLIASRNGVTVAQLKDWNGLRGDRINPGQRLRLEKSTPVTDVPKEKPVQENNATASKEEPKSLDYVYHVVQPGDTLWDIARLYPGVTVGDLQRLNAGLNSKRLSPGKKIKVRVQG